MHYIIAAVIVIVIVCVLYILLKKHSKKLDDKKKLKKDEIRASLTFEEAKNWAYRIKKGYEKYEREDNSYNAYFTFEDPTDEDINNAMKTGILNLRKSEILSIVPFRINIHYGNEEENNEETK
jgi:hypothetical protein